MKFKKVLSGCSPRVESIFFGECLLEKGSKRSTWMWWSLSTLLTSSFVTYVIIIWFSFSVTEKLFLSLAHSSVLSARMNYQWAKESTFGTRSNWDCFKMKRVEQLKKENLQISAAFCSHPAPRLRRMVWGWNMKQTPIWLNGKKSLSAFSSSSRFITPRQADIIKGRKGKNC